MTLLTTPGLQESIENGWPTATLAAIDHPVAEVIARWPDGVIRLWDGVGILRYGGKDWSGIGPFGALVGIGGSKQLKLRAVTFALIGIPAEHEVFLDPRLRNRPAQAWIAGLDESGARVNGAPFQEVDGLCDYQNHKVAEDGSQSIELIVAEPIYSIERAQTLSYTPEWLNDWLAAWRAANISGERLTGFDKMSELAGATRSWTKT